MITNTCSTQELQSGDGELFGLEKEIAWSIHSSSVPGVLNWARCERCAGSVRSSLFLYDFNLSAYRKPDQTKSLHMPELALSFKIPGTEAKPMITPNLMKI